MHLTNYAVNKHNENFVSGGEEDSSKWDFAMLRYLKAAAVTTVASCLHCRPCCICTLARQRLAGEVPAPCTESMRH